MNKNLTYIVLKESGFSLLYRLVAIAASFAMMPVMLQQLGAVAFGAWLVMLSVFQWITSFDLGISSGAKNEMARSLAIKSETGFQSAISTGFFYITIVASFLALFVFLIFNFTPLIQWMQVNAFDGVKVGISIWIVSLGACLIFALNYIQNVYAAEQKASVFSKFSFLTNLTFLLLIICIPSVGEDGLNWMSIFYLSSMLIANAWLISTYFYKNPKRIPKIKYFNKDLRGIILGFGIRLFVIQLAALILFASDKLMVSIFVGPAEVVIFDAAFKIFSLITMFHGILMASLWSAFTHAKSTNDWLWIGKTLFRLKLLMLPIILASVLLAFLAPWIVNKWLTAEQVGTTLFYLLFALATILTCWSNTFANFLNGIGDINMQLYTAIIAAIINIPLSYLFAVIFNLGTPGVIVGTILSLSIFSIIGPFYVSKVINNRLSII